MSRLLRPLTLVIVSLAASCSSQASAPESTSCGAAPQTAGACVVADDCPQMECRCAAKDYGGTSFSHRGAGCTNGACMDADAYCGALCAPHGGVGVIQIDAIASATSCDAYCTKRAEVCPDFPCHRGVDCHVPGGEPTAPYDAHLECMATRGVWNCSRGEVFVDDSACR